jgi:hypothetical protein
MENINGSLRISTVSVSNKMNSPWRAAGGFALLLLPSRYVERRYLKIGCGCLLQLLFNYLVTGTPTCKYSRLRSSDI